MIRLFADDTALFVQGKDVGLVYNDIKKGLIQLKEWFSCNRLTLNLTKTCYNIYHGQNFFPKLYDTMALNGQIINRQSCVKYLGLTIDETFNWGQHVSNLAKSLSKYYGIFNKIKQRIPPKRHKMTIFNSFVHSKICYRIEIYGSLNDYICKRVQIICNKVLKIFFNKNPLYGTNQLHKELNTLQVKYITKPGFWNSHLNVWIQLPLACFKTIIRNADNSTTDALEI